MATGQYYIQNDVLYYDDGSGFKAKGNTGGLVNGKPVNVQLPVYMAGTLVDPITKKPKKVQPSSMQEVKDEIIVSERQTTYTGLKLTPPAAKFSECLRYPTDTSISQNHDYVFFEFYQYFPPFRSDDKKSANYEISPLDAYNYTSDVKNYKPVDGLSRIILYMPEDISAGYKANWSGKNFSNVGANLMQTAGATTVTSGMTELGNTINSGIENFVPIAGAQMVTAAIGKITGESISLDEFIGSTRGVILNPNAELLFSGIDMRNFSLTYKLVPRNASEANHIESIIRTFKKAMLPSANSGAEAIKTAIDQKDFQANYIKVPDVVKVSFMRGGQLNPSVPQYKMCAITSVDVTYTPDGVYATTTDGRMVAYQLSLNFQETKLIFKEDIQPGASY
jgi:hypothetical protein